jgi:CheY-like chemotaxis protein
MLERKGYSVLSAATPAEAIDLAKAHADKIHLLMTAKSQNFWLENPRIVTPKTPFTPRYPARKV